MILYLIIVILCVVILGGLAEYFFEGFVVGAIAGLFVGGWISCSIHSNALENCTYETIVTETKIAAAVVDQVQVSRHESTAHVIYTDVNGKTDEMPCKDVKLEDSDEWKLVEINYDINEKWYDFLADKDTEYIFYVPFDVLYPNMAQAK